MSTMHDSETESQDTTELYDVYLVGSELCGVCSVLWCVRVRVPGLVQKSGIRELGSNACHTAPRLIFFCLEKSVMSDFY
jgi:hypothetical protein